jgi:hypothetical protein
MVGVMALLLDGGLLISEHRHARSVADTAAMAAAYSLFKNSSTDHGLDPTGTARTAALNNATGNGYANDGTATVVTVNIPPLAGAFVGKAGYAEVLVQNNQARLFSALWGAGMMSVTARGVARGISSPSSPAILLLDPSMKASLNVTGNGGINATGGSIVVDSNNAQAGVTVGNGNVTAPNMNFTGSYTTTGSGSFIGTIKTTVSPTSDPLSRIPAPDPSTLTVQSASNYHITSSGNYTLQPGIYTGGISISASGPGLITLMPGIYYMQGGGFFDSGSINMTGTGVMIYNNPASSSDQIKLTGLGNLTISPPTSGTYRGISIFQNRTSTAVVAVTGNGSLNLTGTIYSAGAEVDLTGNGVINATGSQVIANNMEVAGNGAVNVQHNAYLSPVRDTRIVE